MNSGIQCLCLQGETTSRCAAEEEEKIRKWIPVGLNRVGSIRRWPSLESYDLKPLAHFQVSFLHVYHHASISLIWWMITYSAPGGDAYFSAALNSFVHVLMYCYYFTAAALSANPEKKRQEEGIE